MATNGDDPPIVVPEGFTLHTENTSHILLPTVNEAFLNPVQEFNRDLSVACIRVWSEEQNRIKEAKWARTRERKRMKRGVRILPGGSVNNDLEEDGKKSPCHSHDPTSSPSKQKEAQYRPYKFVLLEALSATGLRSIRYAKEIPLVRYVISNDLSPSATAAMKRNVDINGLGTPLEDINAAFEPDEKPKDSKGASVPNPAKIRIHEGDACALMYNHREEGKRVDVVDIDPYGTAAPFIDAAVQCVNDGGLLCVTSTDLSVLATNNYPEKCFSNYGGLPVKAEYCHEAALRLVLHSISTSASRYGRYVQPLLSLSIDFYVRIFVRIHYAPIEVKKALTKTSLYYICTGCQSFYGQPLGRVAENVHPPSGNVNYLFKTQTGPTVPERCPECNSRMHIAGPMWSGSIHDSDFVAKVLAQVEDNPNGYGTSARMKGMLTVTKQELDLPFYFTPAKLAGLFHCICPPLEDVLSALLHAGHKVSRSHACAGSLKTTASREDIHDIYRSWVKHHPVKMLNIPENSPAKALLSKEPRMQANFKRHPDSAPLLSKIGIIRYQQNPTSYWGPGKKATSGVKRKREDESR